MWDITSRDFWYAAVLSVVLVAMILRGHGDLSILD